jgi:hypothetical protein
MTRRLLGIVALALVALVVPSGPASAAPTTTTTHEHGVVETFVDVAPSCEGNPPRYTITTTSNRVEHQTVFADGRVHETDTDAGTFLAVPKDDPSLPSYTGHFTAWDGFNMNGKTVNGTFTFHVHGTGSDGSTLRNHVNGHFNERPNGTVHEFFKCR